MAENNALEPQPGRGVGHPVQQQQQVRAVVIDAEYTVLGVDRGQPQQAAAAPQGRKLGEGHLAAMARLGLKELAQALPAFPDSTVKPVEEPGTLGNVTPQIATNQMGYGSGAADSAWRGQFQSQENAREQSR